MLPEYRKWHTPWLRGAVLGFLAVALSAGLVNGIVFWQLRATLYQDMRDDTVGLASSVAYSLASQIQTAASQGKPLSDQTGLDARLANALARAPGLGSITLTDASQQVLAQARHDDGATVGDLVSRDILIQDAVAGRLDIQTTPLTLSVPLMRPALRMLGLTLVLAMAGGLAGCIYGLHVARFTGRLRQRLNAPPGDRAAAPQRQTTGAAPRDPAARAWRAIQSLHADTAALQERFDGLAQELLAVDFNDRLKPRILALPSMRAASAAPRRPARLPRPQQSLSLRTRLTLAVAAGFAALTVILLGAQAIRDQLQEQRIADNAINDQTVLWREIVARQTNDMDHILRNLLAGQDVSRYLDHRLAEDRWPVDAMALIGRKQSTVLQGQLSPETLLSAGTLDQVLAGEPVFGLHELSNSLALVVAARPLWHDGKASALVAARRLDAVLQRYAERRGGSAHFINLNGQLVASSNANAWRQAGIDAPTRHAAHLPLQHDGRMQTVTVTPVPDIAGGASGVLVSLRDETAAMRPALLLERLTLAAALLFALCGLTAIYLFIWRSFRPLQDAIDTLQSLSATPAANAAGTATASPSAATGIAAPAAGCATAQDSAALSATAQAAAAAPDDAAWHGADEITRLDSAISAFRQNTLQLASSRTQRERVRRRQEAVIASELRKLARSMDATSRDEVMPLLQAQQGQAGDDEGLRRLARVMGHMRHQLIAQHQRLQTMVVELREALVTKTKLAGLQQELQIASAVQLSILPRAMPADPRLEMDCRILPAREVGGDFYDYILLDDHRIGFVIADVSGKGVPAALFMAISRTLLKATAMFVAQPSSCIQRLNDLLAAENEQMLFVTLFYGVLDLRTGDVEYVNAGHPLPYLLRGDGTVETVPSTRGTAVGVMEGLHYTQGALRLAPGDALYLHTDGITEAFDAQGQVYGDARLLDRLSALATRPVAALSQAVVDDVRRFETGTEQTDDITSLCLRYLG